MKIKFSALIAAFILADISPLKLYGQNIASAGISFEFIKDTVNYTYQLAVIYMNTSTIPFLVYTSLSYGEKNSRYCNLVLEIEENVNHIYVKKIPYLINTVTMESEYPSRTFDFPRHALQPANSDTILLTDGIMINMGKWLSSPGNTNKEYRIKFLLRVDFKPEQFSSGTDTSIDFIEYKESAWFYFNSRN